MDKVKANKTLFYDENYYCNECDRKEKQVKRKGNSGRKWRRQRWELNEGEGEPKQDPYQSEEDENRDWFSGRRRGSE
ncbi:hypothetical protein SLE2022_130810 [Rubroshorea leprosula]